MRGREGAHETWPGLRGHSVSTHHRGEPMIFPKKGQTWTYKDRSRLVALAGSLPVIAFLVVGIVVGSLPFILVALMGLVGAGLIWLGAERKYRDEP